MKTYMMTLKRMMMIALLLMVTVSAMADEQNIWLRITGNGKAQVSLDGKTLTFDKDNKATVKGAEGLKVAVSVKPDNGYTVKSVTAQLTIDAGKAETRGADDASFLKVEQNADGDYIFTMPEEFNVIIDVILISTKKETETSPKGPDRSGYYYIINYTLVGNKTHYNASEPQNGYYLCPAAPPANPDDDYNYDAVYYDGASKQKPYLTTYKKGRVNDAVWKVEFAETDNTDNNNPIDYYYLKHCSSIKYLTHNNPIIASDSHRLSVHLQTETDGNFSMFCFETGFDDASSFFIRPRQVLSGNRHLNPTHQNCNYYYGTTDGNKKTTINSKLINLGGMVGYYSKDDHSDDKASQWYLEKLPPVISYNSNNLIEISFIDASYTIYYSYGEESTPSESTLNYSETGPFDPPSGTTVIKAIAIKDNIESGVATFTPAFLLGENHKYLIQSQGNGWTTGNFQGNHYYMIPGDVNNNGKTKVNTTSMLRPSMQWYILNAGDNYYYIVNNVANARMRYNSDYGVHLDAWDENSANEFKFQIVKSSTADTYNIIPYGVTVDAKYLNKASGNAGDGALALHNNAADANSRWKFVPQDTPLADTPPFTPSGASTSVYYKIRNGSGTTFHITPPASADGNATATETTDDATSWYFMQVENPTTTDWLAYYKIINAGTGKALYYNYVNSTSNCLKVGDYDGSNDDYKFAFVKSTTADYYYIVPKSHKDDQLNKISTFYRNSSKILPATTRSASGNVWTFIAADLFCNDPEFVEEDGKIRIKCNTNAAKIYINTESDDDPTSGSTLYNPSANENQNWLTTDQVRIKAIAIVSDGTNTASSSVLTLLNKPVITLTEDGNPVTNGTYIYDGSVKEPVVSEVSIGEVPNKTTATAGTDYETVESTDYSNNLNASTDAVKAKVTLRDKSSSILIWHAEKEFNINPKEVGLTWTPDDSGQTTFTYTGVAQAPTVTASGLIGTDECTVTVTVTADEGSSLKDGEAVNIGSYTATASPLENTNYKLPDAKTRPFTITRAPVTVTADDKTWGFGDDEPELTATITGLVNNESEDLIIYTISRADIENSDGTYTITPAGLTEQGNYSVTYVTGVFTISKKAIGDGTIPAEGITIDITYDGNDYQVTVKQGDNPLEEGDTKDYTWEGTGTGTYVVTVTGHGNYTNSAQATYFNVPFYNTVPGDNENTETAAAYCATQDLQPSRDIKAWYVTKLENNELTIKEVKVVDGENEINYIPANQPVLLLGDPNSKGFTLKPYSGTTMVFPAEGEEDANLLKVVTDEGGKEVGLAEVYVFSKGEFVLSMEGTLTKGKFYLENNSPAFSRSTLHATRGGSTDINDVHLSKTNDQFNEGWYALDGQKLNKKPTRKGIYLQNGKKVVIK